MAGVVGRSVAVEIAVECPRCHGAMALPGVVAGYRCPLCTEDVALPSRWWERVLFRATADSLALPEGRGRTARIRIVPGARLLYGPYRPRCGRCHEALPIEDLIMRVDSGMEASFCPECGERVATRPAPPELRGVHPLLSGVIGEQLDGPAPTEGQAHRWYLLLCLGDDSDDA